MEILHTLGIDWSLLLAQVVNFGIILFILKKFLYRPLLNLIETRRMMVKKTIENAREADRLKEEMERSRADVLRKADEEAGELLSRARKDAEAMRGQLTETAQHQADQILQKGRKQLDDERQHALIEVQEKVATVVMKATEKILDREFTEADQKRILADLQKNLPQLLS